jgi:enamine deaminase RidA (YjgF/YER057c/UK114 family)
MQMTKIPTPEQKLAALGITLPQPPPVIHGASNLPVEVFDETGRHVRAAVGVSALPHHALVEIQMTVRVKAS